MRLAQIGPDQCRCSEEVISPDDARERLLGAKPAGLEHAVIVSKLKEIGFPARDPQPVPGNADRRGRGGVGQCRVAQHGRLLGVAVRGSRTQDDLVPLHLHGVVGRRAVHRVDATDQQIGDADPVTGWINRQAPLDDHVSAGCHGPDAGLGLHLASAG